jgi:hypothetical protein
LKEGHGGNMSETLAMAEMDTDVLEAALFGGEDLAAAPQESPEDAPQPLAEAATEDPAAEVATEEPKEPAEEVEGQEASEEEADAADDVDAGGGEEPADQAAAESAPAEPEEVVLKRNNLPQDEARALELRRRNPDMTLDAALHMARTQLGYYNEDGTDRPSEPTVEDRIADLEAKLAEAGANDGLFTTEIANLTKEHARLCADLAVERAEKQRTDEVKSMEQSRLREESYQRASNLWPEATDSTTPLGQALLQVISEAEATKNPLLYDPQAPELFVAIANARLPENLRVEMKRPAVVKKQTSSGVLARAVPSVQDAGPKPGNVLPVPATARTAQPSNTTLIDPSNVGRAIKEMPTEELEAALLGEPGSSALFRL